MWWKQTEQHKYTCTSRCQMGNKTSVKLFNAIVQENSRVRPSGFTFSQVEWSFYDTVTALQGVSTQSVNVHWLHRLSLQFRVGIHSYPLMLQSTGCGSKPWDLWRVWRKPEPYHFVRQCLGSRFARKAAISVSEETLYHIIIMWKIIHTSIYSHTFPPAVRWLFSVDRQFIAELKSSDAARAS